MGGQNPCRASLSEEERDSTLSSLIEGGDPLSSDCVPLKARKIRKGKRTYPKYIKELKPSSKKLKGFIVGDTTDR